MSVPLSILKNYSNEHIQKISKLEFFLIIFPVEYPEDIVIPDKHIVPDTTVILQEFIVWLGAWF